MFDHGRPGYFAPEWEVTGMPKREQVRRLLAAGLDYLTIGERLGVPAGQAYLIGTGQPADGSDSTSEPQRGRGAPLTGSQRLANPPHENPTSRTTVREWIAARVAADPPMREAAARRGEQPPTIADPDATHDAVTVRNQDHNQLKYLFKQLQAVPNPAKGGSPQQLARRELLVRVIADRVARHEAPERRHLWPTVRAVLSDGDRWAEEGLRQQQEGQDTLAVLVGLAPDTDEFNEHVRQLCRHIAFEDTVFLRLRTAMPAQRLDQWTRQLQATVHTTLDGSTMVPPAEEAEGNS
jgi:hypothetical protein